MFLASFPLYHMNSHILMTHTHIETSNMKKKYGKELLDEKFPYRAMLCVTPVRERYSAVISYTILPLVRAARCIKANEILQVLSQVVNNVLSIVLLK